MIPDPTGATAVRQIKTGRPARGQRVSKYDRLLHIEEELGTPRNFAAEPGHSPAGRSK